MNIKSLTTTLAALALAPLIAQAASNVEVSTGYYDLPPGGGGSPLPLPSPWIGSPNTFFFGNASLAMSGDPDENAILLQNLGATPVVLSAANIGGTVDLFALDSIGSPITLQPGKSYILAGNDGSDIGFTSTVNLTLDGSSVSYNDAVDATLYPSGVLHGYPVSADETVSWTPIFDPSQNVPDESSTLLLAILAMLSLVALQYRLRLARAV